MKTIRRYLLASTSTSGSDAGYSLVFTETGRMYVQVSVQYDQPYKTGEVSDIPQESFSNYSVNDVPLGDLVTKKLEELLPPKPLTWPDVPHIG